MGLLFTRDDLRKTIDHLLTWGRHKRGGELEQFNRTGSKLKIGSRTFSICYPKSDDPNQLFPKPGLHSFVLVSETLKSRLWNNILGRGTASADDFQNAIDTHIGGLSGWHQKAHAEPIADDVKSMVEQSDIFRVYSVTLGPR